MTKAWVITWNKSVIAVVVFSALNSPVYAGEEIESAQVRIRELERQMQQMAEQLKAVQAQLARSAQNDAQRDVAPVLDNTSTKSNVIVKPASGNPVEASFKNGLVFSDAAGDWTLRLYARAQLDYRNFFT